MSRAESGARVTCVVSLAGFCSAQAIICSCVARVCLSAVHENNFDIAFLAARPLIFMREWAVCAVCYLVAVASLLLIPVALIEPLDMPAALPQLTSPAVVWAWTVVFAGVTACDVFLFVTYAGVCTFGGLFSNVRCIPQLPPLSSDKHGNYEEVVHTLVARVLRNTKREVLHVDDHSTRTAALLRRLREASATIVHSARGVRHHGKPVEPCSMCPVVGGRGGL